MTQRKTVWLVCLLLSSGALPVVAQPMIGGVATQHEPFIGVEFVRTQAALEQGEGSWTDLACTERPGTAKLPLVRVQAASSFSWSGNSQALLQYALNMPAYERIRYWSVSRASFRSLFSDSRIMNSGSGPAADGLTAGQSISFRQNVSGPLGAMEQMATVCALTPNLVELDIVNVGPARVFWIKAIAVGDYRLHVRMERSESGSNQWSFKSHMSIAAGKRAAKPELRASYANRALAIMAHLTQTPEIAGHYLQSKE